MNFLADAQLDNFIENVDSGKKLAVSKIVQESVVKVDKDGTEGASATGVELVLLSGSFGEKVDVTVDKPFIFMIQDTVNEIPILVGRINNPLL